MIEPLHVEATALFVAPTWKRFHRNLVSLTVNGVNFTNVWAAASALPAKINGFYYFSYTGNSAWSHFETR